MPTLKQLEVEHPEGFRNATVTLTALPIKKIPTIGEMESERPAGFRNPYQTDIEYAEQRARDKTKHDKETLTCHIDKSESEDGEEDDEEEEYDESETENVLKFD